MACAYSFIIAVMGTGKLVVGVTGASGAIYAQRFLINAAKVYDEIFLILSAQAAQVASTELDVSLERGIFNEGMARRRDCEH